ncbi:MAG TPA: ABC transporter ATP-binding protein [Vicinamibacteria bacterium]|nr:ABC transporter ATP-binding protein [Vicinamibacteria bacterium]
MGRGAVSLRGIRKSFGDVAAVRGVSLDVAAGEFVTLLGPSGCGKTTLLRIVAGLEMPDDGTVLLSGRDVTRLAPHRRPANTVFQHYALFPHRTVAGNVAFGLEMAGRPRAEIDSRVERALEMARLSGMGGRRVDQLSGGQRQRVALARALVLEPDVLLLDEPMSALDRKLREEMRAEVKALHRRLGTTFVFVTHDQEEALALSDRVAVMNDGRVEQVGSPAEVYDAPRTRFVAEFLAVRNLLEARVEAAENGTALVRTSGGLLLRSGAPGFVAGERVWVGVRPERLGFSGAGENRVEGVLEDRLFLGDRSEWRVRAGQDVLTVAETATGNGRRAGDAVTVTFSAAALLRLEAGEAAASP